HGDALGGTDLDVVLPRIHQGVGEQGHVGRCRNRSLDLDRVGPGDPVAQRRTECGVRERRGTAIAPQRRRGGGPRPADVVGPVGPPVGLGIAQAGGYGKAGIARIDRKSTRLNSSHVKTSYAVFCSKKKLEKVDTAMSRAAPTGVNSCMLRRSTARFIASCKVCRSGTPAPLGSLRSIPSSASRGASS